MNFLDTFFLKKYTYIKLHKSPSKLFHATKRHNVAKSLFTILQMHLNMFETCRWSAAWSQHVSFFTIWYIYVVKIAVLMVKKFPPLWNSKIEASIIPTGKWEKKYIHLPLKIHPVAWSWFCSQFIHLCPQGAVFVFVFLFRFHKIQYMSVKTFGYRTSHVITTILNLYMIKSLFTIEWRR